MFPQATIRRIGNKILERMRTRARRTAHLKGGGGEGAGLGACSARMAVGEHSFSEGTWVYMPSEEKHCVTLFLLGALRP